MPGPVCGETSGIAGFSVGSALAWVNAEPNSSELNVREKMCQVVPAARSPDAGIEPASGEAGWKAGAPRKSRRSQGKPALPEKTGTAGFPAGPSLARLNAAPKTQEIAKALQTQANIHPSWTCGRGSAKSLRPQARTGWDEERIPTQSLGVRLSVLRSTTQPPRT